MDTPAISAVTVNQVVEYWRTVEKAKYTGPRSFTERDRHIRVFCSQFGDWPAAQCNRCHVIPWLQSQDRWAQSTKRTVANEVVHVFARAARDSLIAENRLTGLAAEFPPGDPRRPITPDEYRRMLRHSTDAVFKQYICFLWETGARPGEGADSCWPDLDWQKCQIVRKKHKTVAKTRRPRIIRLTAVAMNLMRALHVAAKDKAGHIFLNAAGRPWTAQSLSCRMRTLRARAGIPKDAFFVGLRHSFASQMAATGCSMKVLAELMGHTSSATTERWYTSLDGHGDDLHRALEEFRRSHGGIH